MITTYNEVTDAFNIISTTIACGILSVIGKSQLYRDIKELKSFDKVHNLITLVGYFMAMSIYTIILLNVSKTNEIQTFFFFFSTENRQRIDDNGVLRGIYLCTIVVLTLACIFQVLKQKNKVYTVEKTKIISYLQKNRKVLSIVTPLLLIFIGIFSYFKFVYIQKIDVLSNLSFVTEGVDGSGNGKVSIDDVLKTEQNQYFIDNLGIYVSKEQNLSNGDAVTVSLTVTDELKKNTRMDIEGNKTKFIVEKLRTIPQNLMEMPDTKELDKAMRATIESKYSRNNYEGVSAEVTNVCYTAKPINGSLYSSESLKYGTLVNVYKVVYTHSYFGQTKEYTVFEAEGFTNITVDSENAIDLSYTPWSSSTSYYRNTVTDKISEIEAYGLDCG